MPRSNYSNEFNHYFNIKVMSISINDIENRKLKYSMINDQL